MSSIDPTYSNSPQVWTCSKRIGVVAVIVGLVALGAGICGGMGLLQSHQLITLPTAINTIGNPGLWSMCVAGGLGIAAIIVGTYMAKKKSIIQRRISVQGDPITKIDRKLEDLGFGDHFAAVKIDPKFDRDILKLSNNEFLSFNLEADESMYYVALKTLEGNALITKAITEEKLRSIARAIRGLGFKQVKGDSQVFITITPRYCEEFKKLKNGEFFHFNLEEDTSKYYIGLKTVEGQALITKALTYDKLLSMKVALMRLDFEPASDDGLVGPDHQPISDGLRSLAIYVTLSIKQVKNDFHDFVESDSDSEFSQEFKKLKNGEFLHVNFEEEKSKYYIGLKTAKGRVLTTKALTYNEGLAMMDALETLHFKQASGFLTSFIE